MKIELKDDDKVIIDGFEFYGHIAQKQLCSKCKSNLVYHEDFDAYFVPNVMTGLNPNVATLIVNIVLTVLINHYLTKRVIKLPWKNGLKFHPLW